MQINLAETLKARLDTCSKLAVLGIGSELRGDDAAGVLFVRELRRLVAENPFRSLDVLGFEGANAPENVTGFISSYKPTHILVVDAAEIGEPVGVCREIVLDEISETLFSTHTLPLKVITDYLEQATGATITVLGIQPGNLGFCCEPTPEIKVGVRSLSSCLYGVLKAYDYEVQALPGVGEKPVSLDSRRGGGDYV